MKRPNGYGSIVKLSGKRRNPYGVRITVGYDENNKQIRKFIAYAKTFKEANKILTDYNENLIVDNMTVKYIYEAWNNKAFQNLSQSTINNYKISFKYLKPIENVLIKDLRTPDLQNILDSLSNKLGTQKMVKNLINTLYNYSLKNDYIVKDYSKLLTLDKYVKKIKRKIFTEQEIMLLWDNINEPYVDTILILIYTGFRIGELLSIKKSDINLKDRYIVGGIKTEAGKNRIVPINEKIIPFIEKRLNDEGDYLINVGTQLSKYHKYLYYYKTIMYKLKMNHTIHDTRHTFATLLNNSNVNQTSIKKLIGHSSFITTEKIYTHKDINELRKAVDIL